MPNVSSFKSSLAGQLNQRLWSSPVAGVAVTAGLGIGAAAGVGSYLDTPGPAGDRADAGASSFVKYGTATMGVLGLGAAAVRVSGAFRAGIDGYGNVPINQAIGYGTAQNLKDVIAGGSKKGKSYARGIVDQWQGRTRLPEGMFGPEMARSAGGWKQVLQRPGISGGLGAVVGGVIGNKVSDGSASGTVAGAAVGAGAGIAVGRAFKASATWSKWGSGTKAGAIVAGSIALGMGLKALTGTNYEHVDAAQSEDYYNDAPRESGVRRRMEKLGASGSLVFGMHRSR